MKKFRWYFSIIFLTFFCVLCVPGIVYAQKSFDEEYGEYRLASETYRKYHEEFVLKRSQYLRFRTLKSEEEAYDATLKLLQSRDDVLVSYLEVLMIKLNTSLGVMPDTRDELNALINQERDWYISHRDKLTSAGNLTDLFGDSDEALARFGMISYVSYKTQATISAGRILDFGERIRNVFVNLRSKVGEIKEEKREGYVLDKRKVQLIDRWMLESENKLVRGEERKIAGVDMVVSMSVGKPERVLSSYNKTLAVLAETQVYFKEVSSFLTEVVREIVVAD